MTIVSVIQAINSLSFMPAESSLVINSLRSFSALFSSSLDIVSVSSKSPLSNSRSRLMPCKCNNKIAGKSSLVAYLSNFSLTMSVLIDFIRFRTLPLASSLQFLVKMS